MQCPLCEGRLSELNYEGAYIHACNSCGGEFLTSGDIAQIVSTREEKIDPDIKAQVTDWNPVFGVPSDERQRELRCPGCQSAMLVVNYTGDSGIFVDRCEACGGLWLDHLELEKVQALLERWADEAPAQIQAMAEQLEAARDEVDEQTKFNFRTSRFSFVNALFSRLLDAA